MKKLVLFKASIVGIFFITLFWCGTASANLNGTLWFDAEQQIHLGFTDEGINYLSLDGINWNREPIFKDDGDNYICVEISLLGFVFIKGPYSIADKTMGLKGFALLFWFLPTIRQMEFTLLQTDWAGPDAYNSRVTSDAWHYPLIETLLMLP